MAKDYLRMYDSKLELVHMPTMLVGNSDKSIGKQRMYLEFRFINWLAEWLGFIIAF